ncbi:hypothetical protein K491DRAFT_590130 [Lophiostoma macrostomum CBS 122681]|uniref:Peptidase S59 domain-containing protein n=1 Tax=Lophiostoma macrostomum CBS 122681 TaxID=1314788 RepID=A0A6A6TLR6_9PLEO|nr:hypothetical protein K491DRAFT_590130 [Lophiostoma macrostomum CBS 122681]
MSFGGGGFGSGSGGFGSGSGSGNTFGGFGSNNNNSGFGSNANTSSSFGQQNANTGGGLFGGNTNNTSSSFGGGSGGGFGSNNTAFGSKPFGSGTAGTGGLFGGGGATSGSTFGGFGATANNNTSSGFGSGGSNTGGLFGQNKTGFGAGGTSTGSTSLFGGGGNTTGGFGGGNTGGGGFGSSGTTAFGAGQQQQQQQNYPNTGTANTPFNAFTEKDGTTSGGTQHFQTITLQDPYRNWSLEELRIVDYNQGRRYGNQNGQAGAFGQSSGFGGFGNTSNTTTSFGANTNSGGAGGGLFGSTANNTSSPFGQSNTTTTFGSGTNTTGGGLFSQNKPAGGLFGSTSTSQSTTGGGLFGSSSTNTGAFGSGGGNAFGSSTSGGGLFNQNQAQNKPAFGGFGAGTTTGSAPFGSSTGGFGTNNNASGGGLFNQQNQTSSAPAFGSTNTTSNNAGGLFGGGNAFGQNQNQPQNQQSGNVFGGFGQNNQQNQQKPAGGLFGSSTANTNTGGGLFGASNSQPQAAGGLFGGGTTQNTGNNLFGNKPAATGGLFGSTPQNTGSTGGGLFGGLNTQNNQQNQGSTLFGQQNQQKPGGSLFGNSTTNNNAGGGLFGNLGQNNNQTQQSGGLGGSLFGSQNQQQQQPPQGSLFGASGGSLLQTSINTNPYGNDQLFVGLTTPSQSPGPLATPLSSSQKPRKNSILPQHKLNPSASTRLTTPQNKRVGGYGFSYSTYGSPASASSSSSPGFSGFLGGSGSLTRSLGKSLSTSNLRNSYTPETSILAPGAFSTNGRSYASGSLKKLNINRNINARTPLFDEPPEKKRVSFAGTSNGEANGSTHGLNDSGSTGGELVLRDESEVASPDEGASSRTSSTVNGDAVNGTPGRQEMSQVNGNGLTPVPENGALAPRTSASLNKQTQGLDQTPGEYYSEPPMAQLRKMDRNSLSRVPNFIVGRHGRGLVEFNHGKPVDLTGVDLDKLFGDIVDFNQIRKVQVYGDKCSVPEPAEGSGLNVPSRVTLANSWPRNKAGRKDARHVERLKRQTPTVFETYRPETGEWVFTVPHFSSYGLDYEGALYSDDEDGESDLSDAPDSPAQLSSSSTSGTPQKDQDDSFVDETQSSPDDTFDFKKDKHKRASVPGGYGDDVPYEEDEAEDSMDLTGESFLGKRSVGSLDGREDDYSEDSESEQAEDEDMADSTSSPVQTMEQPTAKASIMPKSILKNSQVLRPTLGTPSKGPLVFDDDWANQLQRTISPKKQDRQALRESQGYVLRERDMDTTKLGQSTNGQGIFTRMEMMESIFGGADEGKGLMKRSGHGIELPYAKRPKTSNDLDELSASDRDFHSCNKSHFTETGILVYTTKGSRTLEGSSFPTVQQPIVGENKDIRFTKLPSFPDAVTKTLQFQKKYTELRAEDGVPRAKIMVAPGPVEFSQLAETVSIDGPAGIHEQQVWRLLSILFDEMDEVPNDMTQELLDQHKERFRKDKLSAFWQSLVFEDAERHARDAPSAEEKAIAFLSGHNVTDACHALLNGLNLRLATMVAQIGGDETMRNDMTAQIDEWRRMDVLAEIEEPLRALYELVAGNCAKSEGKGQPGRENAAATFNIAARFKLDWRRAFGLRLWYGCMIDEPIEMAVAQFADALRDGTEDVKPVPWFTEQHVEMGWQDRTPNGREDLLWGILKLYASSKLEIPANIEDVLAPENVSGHPLNARLSFQLFTLFRSRQDDDEEFEERKVGMPTVRNSVGLRQSLMSNTSASEKEKQAEDPLTELGDKLALIYATSLHTPEYWTTAVFVYAHLSSPALSEHYIRSLLYQYIHTLKVDEADATFKHLAEELRVPVEWIHAAAAVKAKAEGDDVRQTVHLIKARELEEAHHVLCRSVGPECIISRQHDALREILGEFIPTPNNKLVHGWKRGGEIYYDYIELDDLKKQVSWRANPELDDKISALLSKLQKALEGVARDGWEDRGLEERVALTEISGVVAGEIAKNNHADRSHVLKLPLTEDQWLRHSLDLSATYYKAVMASGK